MGEDLSFLFWRRQHPNGRLGAHTGECCPHQTAKLFRTKSQQEVDRRSEKKGYPENGIAFHTGQSSAQLQFYPTIGLLQFFYIFNEIISAAATGLRFATLKLPDFSLFFHSVIAVKYPHWKSQSTHQSR